MKRSVPRLEGRARQVARGELVGRACRIADATDPGYVGLEGTVVDETLHTLTLRLGPPGARRVQLPKAACVFRFDTADGPVDIPGRAIGFRSEDRTKKVR